MIQNLLDAVEKQCADERTKLLAELATRVLPDAVAQQLAKTRAVAPTLAIALQAAEEAMAAAFVEAAKPAERRRSDPLDFLDEAIAWALYARELILLARQGVTR